MAKMLHVLPYALNGGTEKDCYYTIKADNQNRHEVWVLNKPGPMSKQLTLLGISVIHLDILSYSLLKFRGALKKKIGNQVWDGVFYWSSIRLPIIREALNQQQGKLAVHIGNPITRNMKTIMKNIVLNVLYPSTIPTCLFACSKHVYGTIGRDPYLNQFEKTVSLNPVEIPPVNRYHCRNLTQSDNIRLGMVARLDPIKDHATVIRAFAKVIKAFPNARLYLVGEGKMRKTLEDLTDQLGVKNDIIFMGNRDDVYDQLGTWDLFVYATTNQEGLGNTVSEAMANGLPCVVSDLPMMRELTGDNNATLVNPNNPVEMSEKVLELLANPDLRKKLSDNAYQWASKTFSMKRYASDRLKFLCTWQ